MAILDDLEIHRHPNQLSCESSEEEYSSDNIDNDDEHDECVSQNSSEGVTNRRNDEKDNDDEDKEDNNSCDEDHDALHLSEDKDHVKSDLNDSQEDQMNTYMSKEIEHVENGRKNESKEVDHKENSETNGENSESDNEGDGENSENGGESSASGAESSNSNELKCEEKDDENVKRFHYDERDTNGKDYEDDNDLEDAIKVHSPSIDYMTGSEFEDTENEGAEISNATLVDEKPFVSQQGATNGGSVDKAKIEVVLKENSRSVPNVPGKCVALSNLVIVREGVQEKSTECEEETTCTDYFDETTTDVVKQSSPKKQVKSKTEKPKSHFAKNNENAVCKKENNKGKEKLCQDFKLKNISKNKKSEKFHETTAEVECGSNKKQKKPKELQISSELHQGNGKSFGESISPCKQSRKPGVKNIAPLVKVRKAPNRGRGAHSLSIRTDDGHLRKSVDSVPIRTRNPTDHPKRLNDCPRFNKNSLNLVPSPIKSKSTHCSQEEGGSPLENPTEIRQGWFFEEGGDSPKLKSSTPSSKSSKRGRILTMKEFEKSRTDRRMVQTYDRIQKTKHTVDCHMDAKVMDRTGMSNRMKRTQNNYSSLLALENVHFFNILREQKSLYSRDEQFKEYQKHYCAIMGRKKLGQGNTSDEIKTEDSKHDTVY